MLSLPHLPPVLKKILKITGITLLSLMLISTCGCYWLLCTTSGAQFAFKQAQRFTEGIITLGGEVSSGSIAEGLGVDDLVVAVPHVIYISADKFDLAYSLLPLLQERRFEVSQIYSRKLRVHLLTGHSGAEQQEKPQEQHSEGTFRLNFPVDIQVQDFTSEDFAYLSSAVDVHLSSFKAVLRAVEDRAVLQDGVVQNLQVHVKSSTDPVNLSNDLAYSLAAVAAGQEPEPLYDAAAAAQAKAEAEAAKAAAEPVTVLTFDGGDGQIALMPTVALPLNIEVDSLSVQQGRYFQDGFDTGVVDELNLAASWAGTELTLGRLDLKHPLGDLAIKGRMAFEEYFFLDFALQGAGAQTEESLAFMDGVLYGLQGHAQVSGPLTDLKVDLTMDTPADTALKLRLNCLSPQLPVAVELSSPEITYPLTDTGAERLAQVKDLYLQTAGAVFTTLDTQLAADFTGFGFENYKAAFSGLVSLSGVDIRSLTLSGLYLQEEVSLTAAGQLGYQDVISYNGTVDFACTDGGVINEMLRGSASVHGALSAAVRLPATDDEDLDFTLDLDTLQAALFLNGKPASLDAADIHGTLASGFDIARFDFVQSGDPGNTVKLQGRAAVSQPLALSGTVELNDLSALVPALEGDFKATLEAVGEPEQLKVQLTGKSGHVRAGDVLLGRIILDVAGDLSSQSFSVTTAVDSIFPARGMKPYRQCVLDFSGSLPEHALSLFCGGSHHFIVSASGGYDLESSEWKGILEELFFSSEVSGSVQLAAAVNMLFNLGESTGEIDAFTLRTDAGSINAERTVFAPGMLETGLSLKQIELSSLNELMPDDVRLAGPISMNSSIRVHDNAPDISLQINSDDVRVFAQGTPLFFEKIDLNAVMVEQRADLNVDIDMRGGRGALDLNLAVLQPLSERRLDGNISLKDLQLSLFMGVGSLFNDLDGLINLDGKFAGTAAKPLFVGKLTAAGSAEPRFDVGQVDSFDIVLDSTGSQGKLSGYIGLNHGKVNLDGTLDWSDGALAALRVTADKLPAFLMGFGQAYADLDVNVEFNDYFKVAGTAAIPQALISVGDISSSGAKPSSDEILVPEGGTSVLLQQSSAAVPSVIDLTVTIGDEVKLSAMGLESGVEGQLKLSKSLTDSDIFASGKVELTDGRANLYGHHFFVNYARAGFNGPVANPSLDVEIVADPDEMEDNVEAGVRVTGDAQNPKITLFSKPSMSQNEVMSYLLYGHGLDKSSSLNDSSSNSASMLVSLGVSSAGAIANSVVGAFGMRNVEFGSSGSGDDTQVEVQGYITRNIRVGYGYGVFNAIGEFKLRYEFMRRLYAEFASSLEQSVDLIYSFEF